MIRGVQLGEPVSIILWLSHGEVQTFGLFLRVLAKGKLRMIFRFEVLLFQKHLMILKMLQRAMFYHPAFCNDEYATYPVKKSCRYSCMSLRSKNASSPTTIIGPLLRNHTRDGTCSLLPPICATVSNIISNC
ncbi:uncharacterized protein LOC116141710 [Pistacia vera]|uniref:uncharacterized protein LOC116141710 n=1 Tax=Pistacia vera TaxID=55513 RepID=UPI0012635A78|nr:uncharacterized protein LOC116141710 [Pistacia vera]